MTLQFTYINLAFAPAPDDIVINLYKVRRVVMLGQGDNAEVLTVQSFATEGHLIVNYRFVLPLAYIGSVVLTGT